MQYNTTQHHRYQTSNNTLCDITQHNITDVKQVKNSMRYNTTQQNRCQTRNKTLCDITQHNKTDIKQVIKHSAI